MGLSTRFFALNQSLGTENNWRMLHQLQKPNPRFGQSQKFLVLNLGQPTKS